MIAPSSAPAPPQPLSAPLNPGKEALTLDPLVRAPSRIRSFAKLFSNAGSSKSAQLVVIGYAALSLPLLHLLIMNRRTHQHSLVISPSAFTSFLACCLVAVLALTTFSPAQAANERPNIILIFVDDMGYGDNWLTNPFSTVSTPNIQALADNGVNFTNAYVAAPACSPSRASLLTSIAPNRYGADNNSTSRHRPHLMPATTIASLIEGAAGQDYRTGIIGKWDLAGRSPHPASYLPIGRGFGSFYGIKSGISSYYPTDGSSSHNLWYWNSSTNTAVNPDPNLNEVIDIPQNQNITRYVSGSYVTEDPDNFLTNKFRKEAIAFIEDYTGTQDDPFFLFLSFNAPHKPYMAPNSYYQAAPGSGADRIYNAMIANIDDNVGLIMDQLDLQGITDDTLVIFISDNGAVGSGSSGVLTGGKNSLYEGGIHTSWAMSWPNQYGTTSQIFTDPVTTLDILPTIAIAAGCNPANFDTEGVDLTPYLDGTNSGTPHDDLFWRYIGDKDFSVSLAVRSGDYKYMVQTFLDGSREEHLYDLGTTLVESPSTNLASDSSYATTKSNLIAKLNAWNAENPFEEDFDNNDYTAGKDGLAHGFISYLNASTAADAWLPVGEKYKVTDGLAGDRAVAEMTYFEDATFECDMKLKDNGKAALIFRSSDHSAGSLNFYGYYAQIAAGTNNVKLFRVDHGTKTEIASASKTIALDTYYSVQVVANGSSIKVYVDNTSTPLIDTTDSTYSGGSVGLRVGTPSGTSTTTAHYDNLIVTPL